MEKYFKPAGGLFGRLVIATVLNIFIVISFLAICTGVFTKSDGYNATVTDKNGKVVSEYVFSAADGQTDQQRQDYEAQGYTVKTVGRRTELSGKGYRTFCVVSEIFTFCILTAFIYPRFWELGTRDSNAVHFGRMKENILRGLWCGLLAVIPFFAVWLAFVIMRWGIGLYSLSNASFYSLIMAAAGKRTTFGDIAFWRQILMFMPTLFVPLIAELAYFLGYKDISVSEKMVYKKKEKR